MFRKVSLFEKIFYHLLLIAVAAIMLLPIVYVITGSFKSNSEIFIEPAKLLPDKVVLDNYKQLIANADFNVGRLLFNTVIYTVWCIFVNVLICPTGAYVFARGNFPGKKLIFTLFTSLMFIGPGAITIYCQFDIVRAVGLPISLYTNMFLALFGIPITNYYIIKGYIDSVPKDLDESAKIDGCSFIGIYFRIIFHMITPVLATQVIFAFQGAWNNYIGVLLWTSSRPWEWTLTVGIMMMRNSGDAAIGIGFTMAAAVISMIPVIIVFCIFNKYIVDGISAGAVKA